MTVEKLKSLMIYVPEYGEFIALKRFGRRVPGDVLKTKHSEGYSQVSIEGKHYLIHRLVWLYNYGYMPEFIDHIDRDRLNNKLSNLRDATRIENQQNLSMSSSNTTGYSCISPTPSGFLIQKTIAGIRMSSSSRTIEDAIAIRETMLNGTFTGTVSSSNRNKKTTS